MLEGERRRGGESSHLTPEGRGRLNSCYGQTLKPCLRGKFNLVVRLRSVDLSGAAQWAREGEGRRGKAREGQARPGRAREGTLAAFQMLCSSGRERIYPMENVDCRFCVDKRV